MNNNIDGSWDDILYWLKKAECTALRIKDIEQTAGSVSTIFVNWPALKRPLGYAILSFYTHCQLMFLLIC